MRYISALDIGSDYLRMAVQAYDDQGVATGPCYVAVEWSDMDWKGGSIANSQVVSVAIKRLRKQLEEKIGGPIERVALIANVGEVTCNQGSASCVCKELHESRMEYQVSQKEVDSVLESTRNVPADTSGERKYLFDSEPLGFYIMEGEVKCPLRHPNGTAASALYADYNAFLCNETMQKRLSAAIELAGLRVESYAIEARANALCPDTSLKPRKGAEQRYALEARAVATVALPKKKKKWGNVLLHMGYTKCELLIDNHGIIERYAWIPLGGHSIASDYANKYRCSPQEGRHAIPRLLETQKLRLQESDIRKIIPKLSSNESSFVTGLYYMQVDAIIDGMLEQLEEWYPKLSEEKGNLTLYLAGGLSAPENIVPIVEHFLKMKGNTLFGSVQLTGLDMPLEILSHEGDMPVSLRSLQAVCGLVQLQAEAQRFIEMNTFSPSPDQEKTPEQEESTPSPKQEKTPKRSGFSKLVEKLNGMLGLDES